MAEAQVAPEKKPTCFVVCPIGDDGSEAREHSNYVLKFIITPVLGDTYDIVRADNIHTPGKITSQIVNHLANAEMVIADLTWQNPNVMYELAVRHALKKPFVQMITKGHKIPFDVGEQRTIPFNLKDLQSVEDCKGMLAKHVEAARAPDFVADTPLSELSAIVLDVASKPKDEVMVEILSQLKTLRSEMSSSRGIGADALRIALGKRPMARYFGGEDAGPGMSWEEFTELVMRILVEEGPLNWTFVCGHARDNVFTVEATGPNGETMIQNDIVAICNRRTARNIVRTFLDKIPTAS
jgi:hypothetical protein